MSPTLDTMHEAEPAMTNDEIIEHITRSWEEQPLRPRPGFGFYPDFVWSFIEDMTEENASMHNVDISNYSIPDKDKFMCAVVSELWQDLFPWYRQYDWEVCTPMWDGASCLPPVPPGDTAVFPCMKMFDGTRYYPKDNATRECLGNGSWVNRTNYSSCEQVHLQDDPWQQQDLEISIHVYFVGYSISLLALIFALCIFLSFREMRCLRHKIHIGLFLTYIFTNLAWILTSLLQTPLGEEEENTTIFVLWCSCRNVLNYFHLTTFFWMFLEGLYLFLQVQIPLSLSNIKHKHFLIFGWGLPALDILIWGILRVSVSPLKHNDDGSEEHKYNEVSGCPFQEELSVDFYMYNLPILILLLANTFFLVWIMVIVISKLRAQTVMEYDRKHWKAAKALIVIIPLLGFTYLLTLIGPDKDMYPTANLVFQFIRALLLSTQGFVITLPYCFLNSEVRSVITTRLERWRLVRSVGADSIRNSTAIMLKPRIQLPPGYSTYFTTLDPRAASSDRCRGKLLNVPAQDVYEYHTTNGSTVVPDFATTASGASGTPDFTVDSRASAL